MAFNKKEFEDSFREGWQNIVMQFIFRLVDTEYQGIIQTKIEVGIQLWVSNLSLSPKYVTF